MKQYFIKILAFMCISSSCLLFGVVLSIAQTSGLETGIDFDIELDEKGTVDDLTTSNQALANICMGEKWWIRFYVNGACWAIGETFEFPVEFSTQGIVGVNWTKEDPPLATITVPVKIGNDCNGESDIFYATGLMSGYTIMTACAPGVGCLDNPPIYDFSVNALYSIELLEADAILGENSEWAGGGKQIFPGKQTPDDTANRSKVQIKVATSKPDATVFFKSFDMDDPANSLPEDLNGTGLAGNDNRGTPRNGKLSATSVQTDINGYALVDFEVTMHPGDNFMVAASCSEEYLNGITVQGYELLDSDGDPLPTGKALVTPLLTVWRRFHVELDSMATVKGNEIRGVVNCPQSKTNSCDKTDNTGRTVLSVEQLSANGVPLKSLNDGGRNGRFENGHITLLTGPPGGQEYDVATNSRSEVTLTSTISSVPNNTVVFIVDDDNYNGDLFYGDEGEAIIADPNTSVVFSLMRDSNNVLENVFASAFLRPTYDEAGVPPENDHDGGLYAPPSPLTIKFDLNVSDREAPNQISSGVDSQGKDDYWVVYIQLGYQGNERYDKDPKTEHGLFPGVTSVGDPRKDLTNSVTGPSAVPKGGDGTLLFLEDLLNEAAIVDRSTTAPHEVGHQFGLRGDRSGFGIMSDVMTNQQPVFVPDHLNILRSRVKSPGQ